MKKDYDYDHSLKVGDYVINRYAKNQKVYRITEITPRPGTNPYYTSEEVFDFDPLTPNRNKVRKVKSGGDIYWVTKIDKKMIKEMLDRWEQLLIMVK